jgi:hypothetical protein
MSLDLLAVFGRNRHAFMFPHAMNVTIGVKEDIQLMGGGFTLWTVSTGLITRETTRNCRSKRNETSYLRR